MKDFIIKLCLCIFIINYIPNFIFGKSSSPFSNGKSSVQLEKKYNYNSVSPDSVVVIKSTGIELSYDKTEIHAKAGDILLIRYINESDMNHNFALVREEQDIRPVGVAALQAVSNDWIPEKEMNRIIAYSELAHSGDTVEVSFKVPPPGTYPYICTYSAHWTQMQGRLISKE